MRARRGSWELEGTPPRLFLVSQRCCQSRDARRAITLFCVSKDEPFIQMGCAMNDVIHGCTENNRGRRDRYRGFTLVEVLVALTILTMAGSALLLTTYTAMDSATDSMDQAIAQGIARQFLDEAMGLGYAEPGSNPLSGQLGPEEGEAINMGRVIAFDDTDDFAGYHATPLVDPWGKAMGTGNDQGDLRDPNFQLSSSHFKNWELKSTVVYVDETNPEESLPAESTSGMRAIEVSIYKRQGDDAARLLFTMRRVYSHVPSPQ